MVERAHVWGFEGLLFAWCPSPPAANLEAHELFKLHSINLSPAAELAWSDSAQCHTHFLIVFAVSLIAELEASTVWEK
jgi:hypothetical protein